MMDEQWYEDTLHTKQAYLLKGYKSSIISKTVHHVWILLVTKANVAITKRCMPETHSHTAHTLYALLVSHTITVQGIRNDDQSLSPVTPLVPLLSNPLKCSGTFKFNLQVYILQVDFLGPSTLYNYVKKLHLPSAIHHSQHITVFGSPGYTIG